MSGGENVGKGLAGPHAYEVFDFAPNDFNPDAPSRDKVLWLRLRNPWGQVKERLPNTTTLPGRIYEDKVTHQAITTPTTAPFKAKAEGGDSPEFWLTLADLTKRFANVYYGTV